MEMGKRGKIEEILPRIGNRKEGEGKGKGNMDEKG